MADPEGSDLTRRGFRVGDWYVRPLMNRISHDDHSIVLEPKVMEVLVCLAKSRGETVTKEQFMTEVWGGTIVTDDVLSRCISELRKALHDDWRDPHVIETIRKTGYRLIAPVQPIGPEKPELESDRDPTTTAPAIDNSSTAGARKPAALDSSNDDGDYASDKRSAPNVSSRGANETNPVSVESRQGNDAGPEDDGPPDSALDDPAQTNPAQANPAQANPAPRDSGTSNLTDTAGSTERGSTDREPIRFIRSRTTTQTVLLVASIALVGILILLQLRTEAEPAPPVPIPFTSTPGLELDAAISPDGRQVAFASDNGNGRDFDIYIAQAGAEIPLRLTDDPGNERHPVWSPDGLRLAFVRDTDETQSVLVVPSIGGSPRNVAIFENRTVFDIAWAAEGRMIAIVAQRNQYGPSAIYVVAEDSLNAEQEMVPLASTDGARSVAFSPDGSRLAFVRAIADDVQDIFVASIDGKQSRQVTFDSTIVAGIDWAPDGDDIIFASTRNGVFGLWKIDATGGTAGWVLTSVGGARLEDPTISRTGNKLMYVERTWDTNLWRLWREDDELSYRAHPLVFSTRWDSHPDISPDGARIAYASDQSGQREIWVADRTGASDKQLTQAEGANKSVPRWSPDGRELVFVSRTQGRTELRVIGESGGGTKSVGSSPRHDAIPSWSRDGTGIYYASDASGRAEIWRAPRDSGTAVQVTTGGGMSAIESADGKYLYYVRPDTVGIWRIPLVGTSAGTRVGELLVDSRQVSELVVDSAQVGELVVDSVRPDDLGNWSVVQDGIYHVNRGRGNPTLMFYSFLTNENTLVAPLRNLPMRAGLAISPDRSWIVVSQEDDVESDIMMMAPFE